ncbi:MAG TPA: hypothetical protein VNA57_02805 [Acidimicrobiales bacterium]|nr:hypothetical protein [Acidimicrobiales bacterium]
MASASCVMAVAVELLLYRSYKGHDARFHWFTHFFVGAAVALLAMAVVAWRTRHPVALPMLWPLLGHLVAMAPDILFNFGMAHRRWMDVFLAHVSSHYVPGRNVTWFGVFLASLAVYLVVLDRRVSPAPVWAGK